MTKIIFSFLLLTISFLSNGQEVAVRQKQFLLKKNVALEGYDPVSYFSKTPKKGTINHIHDGISYRFATEANLETFKKNPSKYEPAYGGWCAYAMGKKNEKVEVDPKNYKIVDGRLMLFYKDFFSNTLDDWNEAEAILKKQADANWKKTLILK